MQSALGNISCDPESFPIILSVLCTLMRGKFMKDKCIRSSGAVNLRGIYYELIWNGQAAYYIHFKRRIKRWSTESTFLR